MNPNAAGRIVTGMNQDTKAASPRPKRGWLLSIAVALAVAGVGTALSATINPALDRTIHWDWAGSIAAFLVVFLSLSLRNRWL